MFLRPQSVHQWRQCDSASYCLNYLQEGSNFFFPRVMFQMAYKGYVISEFPIIYWLSGKLYRVFGVHEAIPRLLSYFVFLLGLIFLFELGLKLFKNKWYALVPVLIVYSSPLVVYYALNYLPNIPALGLTLISWYFFFGYISTRSLKNFYLCSVFALFAALLKPVEMFNYLIMATIICLEYFNFFNFFNSADTKYYYKISEIKRIGVCIIGVLSLCYFWILYAQGYADAFGYDGNLLSIMPIWEMSEDEINATIDVYQTKWGYQFFHPFAWKILMIFILVVLYFYKRVNKYLLLALVFSILAQFIYVILFFQVFYHHDYYLINIFIVPVLTIIAIIQVFESFELSKSIKYVAVAGCTLFICFTLKHSNFIIHSRYFGFLKEGINPAVQTITPYLRSIGIAQDDLVISIPDPSINVSLYLMNQKGWTCAYGGSAEKVKARVNSGAKYLIVHDTIIAHPEWYQDYMKQKIGEYQGVKIYKIH
ncbi:ArnT family glycosyltransferase [Sporocytophaga myxococcoides]|uniref:ArnT family glycosyltransferase n=1 Tax=Sporocytophaga myxococcoides TaxID=153721 RepID=UPI00138AD990|nr:glycosyltransferase family 39 protein [Sporocytophaga myxococcoides]